MRHFRSSLVAVLLLGGCTTTVMPQKPPISLIPAERPALVDEYGSFSKPGREWLTEVVNAYLRNCITLQILRGESPQICERGIR